MLFSGSLLGPRENLSPDTDIFKHLVLLYTRTHGRMGIPCPMGYPRHGFPEGITNGAAWYPVPGRHFSLDEKDPFSLPCTSYKLSVVVWCGITIPEVVLGIDRGCGYRWGVKA